VSRFRGFGDVFMQLAEERPVAYYPKLVKVTGSVNAAIFLSQLGYWTPKAADPDGWVYKTQIEWESETGLTRWEQETARRQLRDRGIVAEVKRGMPARLFFQIDVDALTSSWEAAFEDEDAVKPHPRMGDSHNQGSTNGNSSDPRMRDNRKQQRGRASPKDVGSPQANRGTGTTSGTTSTTTGGGGEEAFSETQLRQALPDLMRAEGIPEDLMASALDQSLAALRITLADGRLTTGPVAYCLGVAKRIHREHLAATARVEAEGANEQRRLEFETTCPHGTEWGSCAPCDEDIQRGRALRAGFRAGEAVA
jgi:hypothetical protein